VLLTGGHWEKAKECFNQMLAQNCRPDGITFSALITAYQRGNQWREALQAFSHMPSNGCHPDSVVYNALLEVCWGSGVLPVQMRATQIWSLANRSGHFRCGSAVADSAFGTLGDSGELAHPAAPACCTLEGVAAYQHTWACAFHI
jgi:pentatricopeptide repeat protein